MFLVLAADKGDGGGGKLGFLQGLVQSSENKGSKAPASIYYRAGDDTGETDVEDRIENGNCLLDQVQCDHSTSILNWQKISLITA